MKLLGAHPPEAETERSTRERVCREVLERGPVTASQLAAVLGLTPAAVRRHLDGLVAEGLATTWEAEGSARRGRGRPARRFVLTDDGHAAMATGYDDLAAAALQFLAEVAGEDAVRRFASVRAEQLAARYGPSVDAAGPQPQARAAVLAEALSTDGYAATTRPLTAATPPGAGRRDEVTGSQLCQGHCPVQHVAARFPQLCEAETEAFSRLLGVHVQRLATLAGGAHVCTTHIPAAAGSVPVRVSAAARTPVPVAAPAPATPQLPSTTVPNEESTRR